MMPRVFILASAAFAVAVSAAELPPPVVRAVDFEKDVRPIFEKNCVK